MCSLQDEEIKPEEAPVAESAAPEKKPEAAPAAPAGGDDDVIVAELVEKKVAFSENTTHHKSFQLACGAVDRTFTCFILES